MYKMSQLGAAEPRGGCKTRCVSYGGKTLSPPPAASLGMAMPQCAHAPQLASKEYIGLFFRQLAQPVVKKSRLRRF